VWAFSPCLCNVEKQTVILEKMNSSLVDIAYSQKDIASSQKQNHSEMISILKKIGNSLEKIEQKS